MIRSNFEDSLQVILHHEGGYVNHPSDPGGATNKGITQDTYDKWRRLKRKGSRSVRLITDEEVENIYEIQYWNLINGDKMPAGVALVVFDFAVNSGPTRAIKTLQAVLKIRQDGDAGATTLEALRDQDPAEIINELSEARLRFMRGLSTWTVFGRGWKRRVDSVRASALRMVGADVVASFDGPEEDVDGSAKADGRQYGFMNTSEGRGTVAASAGTVGTLLSDTAERFEKFAEFSWVFQVLFGVLTIAGIGFVAYSMISRIKSEG